MPLPPALSTMWSQLRHQSLAQFIDDAQQMGFAQVELGHVVPPAWMESLPAAMAPHVRVLHHPCPNPGGVPHLSALDPESRADASTALVRTMEWAARVGAQAVVLHLGTVALDPRWEQALRARWLQGDSDSAIFEALRTHLLELRAATAHAHLDAVRRALDLALPLADRWGLQLGMENGEWVAAIPNVQEAGALLSEYETPTLGVWVDTGHATILERLGVGSLQAWLALAPQRLLGLHLHDVAGLRDHLLPGRGTIPWERVAAAVPESALPTLEVDWYYHAEEVVEGALALARAGLIRFPPR